MSREKSQRPQTGDEQHPVTTPAHISTQIALPIRVRNEADHLPMAKGKGKKKSDKHKNVQEGWKQYFGTNDNNLAKWQQLGRDLGVPEEKLTSKTQIRKALQGIWVNIYDFLYHAENKPGDVEFFKSERELSDYTMRTRKIYPRKNITPGSPLRDLLAHIFSPRGGNKSYK